MTFPKGFRPMLAAEFEERRLVFPMYIQPKFDGIRCLCNKGLSASRTLKPIPNGFVQSFFREYGERLHGLDGELTVGEPTTEDVYRRTSSGLMSHGGEPDFIYHVFDCWINPQLTYLDRYNIALNRISSVPRTRIAYTQLVHNLQELYEAEARFMDEGFEGTILRSPRHGYKFNRATALQGQLVKLKRFADTEALVVGMEELHHNDNVMLRDARGYAVRTTHKENKRAGGMMGKLLLQGNWEDGREWTGKVGTGFSRDERIEIWANPDKYIGKMVKIRYLEVGLKDRPRHPSFQGWRHPIDMGVPAPSTTSAS